MRTPNCCYWTPRSGGGIVAVAFMAIAISGRAQTPLAGSGPSESVNLFNTDLAVLDAGQSRNDLPCTVTPDKPELGFDLRFHAGYEVSVPINEFAGSDNMLTILFRVTSEARKDKPAYFTQHVRVPWIEEDAKGEATLQGAFDLGPGKYHVDWLLRDRSERVCADSWDAEAELGPKDKDVAPSLIVGAIERAAYEQFQEDPPIRRTTQEPLNVKVLINFAPQDALSATLPPVDTSALVSILRTISREPKFVKFSVTAFNMQDQKVLYRQQNADRIDFPALGEALHTLKLGTVALQQLSEKHGDTQFLASLIRNEAGNPSGRPDALIFAGPKVMLDDNIPADSLKQMGDLDFPVFYMNYSRNPQMTPWKDTISRAVKFFRGTEYTISRPRDLWFAVSEMVSRIVKSRNERPAAAISTR